MKVPILPPRIPIYINNGYGRDTYISFYNGGFSNYKYSKSYKKDYYQIPMHRNHPDLFKRRPIDKYQISGEGRDFFIFKGIQTEHDRIADNSSFERTLRTENSPIEYHMSTKRPRNKFEKKLINRIFYGKCQGMKDRQMSPKVKFKKDILKEKEEKEEENKENNNESFRNTSNSISLRNTFLRTSRGNENNNIFTHKNNNKNIKDFELLFTPMNTNKKKKLTDRNPNTNQSEDLINSVKKIFLYNRKNKVGTEV